MRTRKYLCISLSLAILRFAGGSAIAETAKSDAAEAAILKHAQAFVDAFAKADAKALAAFWTPDGDYVDQTGRRLKGRDEIEKAFAEMFSQNNGLTLRVDVDSIRMVTPDVAVEDGVTSVIPADGSPPSRTRYSIVHVKKDGEWSLESVREAAYAPPSQYEHLRAVEWLIGDWVDEAESGEMARVSLDWTDNQNFILGSFTSSINDIAVAGGTQWIGWDASRNQIRSWTFESSGGFGEGTWSPDGDKVVIKSTSVLQDGGKLAATQTITRIDADTLTWQSTNRTLNGASLPDIAPIRMTRSD